MGNKVWYGLSNVHVAKMTVAEDGTITYGTPFAVPGGVRLGLDAQGEESPFYADNIKYFATFTNNGYSGDLEIALIPKQFEEEILGQKTDSNGAVFENINDKISPFAFMYQVEGDETGTRFCYYNAIVSRPSSEAQTVEETITPNTNTLSITTSGRNTDNEVRVKLTKTEENATVYESFFDSVYEKAV